MVNFGKILKSWSLRSNSVTRQVRFNRPKIGGNWKTPKLKNSHATFWVIFKQCAKFFKRQKLIISNEIIFEFSKIKIDIYLTKGLFATIHYKVDDGINNNHDFFFKHSLEKSSFVQNLAESIFVSFFKIIIQKFKREIWYVFN